MYILLLILKYLGRKLAPLFAALAVTLCTAMVIIVISVMGGFLNLMKDAARTLTGDITIRADLSGFPHYQEMIEALRPLPGVAGAAPMISGYGLINLEGRVLTVEVTGIDPISYNTVARYESSLHWTTQTLIDGLEASLPAESERTEQEQQLYELRKQRYLQMDLQRMGMTLTAPAEWATSSTASVLGIEVSPYNMRSQAGQYSVVNSTLGVEYTLTVLPITQRGAILEPAVRRMVVVNEFKSGLYDVDANRVYVPLSLLQQMLKMDEAEEVDPQTGQTTGQKIPARVSEVVVKVEAGADLDTVEQAVKERLSRFMGEKPDMPGLRVASWRERHATLIGAVEKEKFLLTILFAIISIVAVAMIGVIFYMIVMEKTRDIGVMRALGASRLGIASIFLGYGLVIGILGAFLGFWLAAAVVWNINEIQAFLTARFGFTMWDPRVYYFDKVPSRLDPNEVTIILLAAVFSSVLGSVIPAWLAARLKPVEALRYE